MSLLYTHHSRLYMDITCNNQLMKISFCWYQYHVSAWPNVSSFIPIVWTPHTLAAVRSEWASICTLGSRCEGRPFVTHTPCTLTPVRLSSHTCVPSCHHTIIPPYHHTIIPSYIIPSYHHTIIPSYHHTTIPSSPSYT